MIKQRFVIVLLADRVYVEYWIVLRSVDFDVNFLFTDWWE